MLVEVFLSAEIPLYKLRNPKMKAFFKSLNIDISETSARNHMHLVTYPKIAQEIKKSFENQKFFLSIDESYLFKKKIFVILIGKCEEPKKMYCVGLKNEETSNSETVVKLVQEVISEYELKPENFLLFLSDAASYNKKAITLLKIGVSNLQNVFCKAHLLHNCAMRVKDNFDDVNNLISRIKAITIKNNSRSTLYGLVGKIPDVIVTRWSSWLKAACWYSENFRYIKEITSEIPNDGVLIDRAKKAVEGNDLVKNLAYISKNYKIIIDMLTRIEEGESSIKKINEMLILVLSAIAGYIVFQTFFRNHV